MIEQLKAMPKYEAYKDSGAEWLGNIPASWQIKRFKFLYRDVSQKGRANAELLSVTQNQGVVPRTWVENRMVMPSGNLESFKFIEKGDFAISLRSFEGGLEYCHHDGIISPAYTVLKRNLDSLCDGYYRFIFKSLAFISELQTSIVGIREGKNISFEELSYSLIPIPPISEQSAIAAFLDRKTAQIDQAVAIKEKQIALLKERKQILIQNAVTRGLNPDAPMRDSGVEWIGEIPAHWICARLKMHSKIQSGITLGKSYLQQNFVEMPYIRVANVQSGYFKLDDIATISVPKHEIPRYLLQNGDILVTEGGDIDKLGRGTVWRDQIKPCLHQNHVFAIRVNKSILNQDFVSNFLATDMARKYFIDTATKTTNLASTNRTHLGNLYLPMPSLTEQAAIVAHIETESAKIDRAISLQQKQIDKLKEYKTTLINSAVTGKIRVSERVEGSVPELADTMVV
jgi:type I restriction enzyme S subunit